MKRAITAVLLSGALSGCGVLPESAYSAPYPNHLLARIEDRVLSIEYVTFQEARAACSVTYGACSNTTEAGTRIYIATHLEDGTETTPYFRECAVRHEKSHTYDIFVRGLDPATSQLHAGWLLPFCTLEPQFVR